MLMHDVTLVRQVYSEPLTHGCRITAILTRFGDLCVFVWDRDMLPLWQGDNILEARQWVCHNRHMLATTGDL